MAFQYSVLMALCLLGETPSPKYQPVISHRQAFNTNAPAEIVMGRVWSDVVWFHMFASEDQQHAWERQYANRLNAFTESPTDLRLALADVLGDLSDPTCMVLGPAEGLGGQFQPLIYAIRPEGIFIIGGDAAQISHEIGPISGINGIDLAKFVAPVAGRGANNLRTLAALHALGQSPEALNWKIRAGGEILEVHSLTALPPKVFLADAPSANLMSGLLTSKGEGIPDVPPDFRDLHWFKALPGSLRAFGQAVAPKLVKRVASTPLVRATAFRQGFIEGPRSNPAGTFLNMVLIDPVRELGEGKQVPRLPEVIIDPVLSRTVCNFGLTESTATTAAAKRYTVADGIDLVLSTGVYAPPQKAALLQGAQIAMKTFSGLIRPGSARAMTAGTLINYDHLFSFTPADRQQMVFEAAVRAFNEGKDAGGIAEAIAPALRDAHYMGTHQVQGPFYINEPKKFNWRGFLPFLALPGPNGGALIVQSLDEKLVSGMEVMAIEGKRVSDLMPILPKISSRRAEDHSGRIFSSMSSFLSYNAETVPLTVRGLDGREVEIVARRFSDESEPLQGKRKILPDVEWYSCSRPASFADIRSGLEAGKTVVLDLRFNQPRRPFTVDSTPLERSVVGTGFYRQVEQPTSWGVHSPQRTVAISAVYHEGKPLEVKRPGGRLIMLVAGSTLSTLETYALMLRRAFPDRSLVVGLPTAGTTTPVMDMRLPAGDDRYIWLGPTPGYVEIDRLTLQYVGVPLDAEVTLKDLRRFAGDTDALGSWVIAELEKGRGAFMVQAKGISRPQSGSHKPGASTASTR